MKDMIIAFSLTTAVIVGVVLYYRKKNKELKEVFDEEEEYEPSPPIEGFQGLPDKAPIKTEKGWNVDVADSKYLDEFVNKAEKVIQNHKPKKYPVNRRRKKRSGK